MSDLACPSGSGSQASPEAPSDLRPAGVDPSRGSGDLTTLSARDAVAEAVHDLTCEDQGILPWAEIRKFRGFPDGYAAKRAYALADAALTALARVSPTSDLGAQERPTANYSKDFQLMLVRIIQRHRNGRDLTETLEGATDLLKRKGSLSVFRSEAPAAQGIEARSDETQSGSAEGESPVATGDAP